MRARDLKIDSVYSCENQQHKATMMYYGMAGDKYTFIPYDVKKRHYNGAPCSLTEKEVTNLIKPIA